MTANPGGVKSTVVSPLNTAQTTSPAVPAGRTVIDQAAVYATFTSSVYENV